MGAIQNFVRLGTRGFLAATIGLFASGCGSSLVPPRQGLAMRDISYPMREMRFPSGLRVLAEKDERQPLVGLVLVVGAGSSADPAGKEGLAHYVEHLAFRSKPFGKSSFKRLLERAGAGQWNAYTGFDHTVYYELGPKVALGEMLQLEGARMLNPVAKLAPETLSVELEVVRSELRQRNETGLVGEVFGTVQGLLFPKGHPYARPVVGTHESLSSIGVDDVAAFLQANYKPDNMTLHIIGDVDLNTIDALVQQSLPPALLAGNGPPPPVKSRIPAVAPEPPAPPAPPAGGLLKKEGAVATPEIWIGWSLPRAFDTDAYLAEITKSAASEALRRAPDEDQDIAFVSTELVHGKEASMLLARVALTRGNHPERSLDHVLNRVHEVWTKSQDSTSVQVGEIAFTGRKRQAVVGLLLEAEDIVERGTSRATATHFSGDPALYSRAFGSVIKLEQSRMLEYAKKYLSRERARAVVFSPPAGQSALPPSPGVSAPADDEEDKVPIRVDLERLRNAAPPLGASDWRWFSLENGLEVVVAKRPGLPIAAVGLMFRGGIAAAEDPAAAVAGSFFALAGDHRHGFPTDFGGHYRHGLRDGHMLYEMVGAAGNAPIMIAMVAERARSMGIDTGRWDTLTRDTVPYFQFADQKPETIAMRAFKSTLFGAHPLGHPTTGADIANLSAGKINDWYGKTHVPDNAVLVVVGEVDPIEIEAVVRDQLGDWSKGGYTASRPSPNRPGQTPLAQPNLVVTNRPGATQAQINFACILPPAESRAGDVRHDLAASLAVGRINHVLREEFGLTYGIHGGAFLSVGGMSTLRIEGAVERSKLGFSLSAIQKSLAWLGEQKVTPNDFAWAKLRLARSEGTRFLSNDAILSAVVGQLEQGFPLHDLDGYAKSLDAVTPDDVLADLRACAAGNPTFSIVGDEAEARAAFKAAYSPAPAPAPAP